MAGLIFGEVTAERRRPYSLLVEDDFSTGPQGWRGLMTSARPEGFYCLDSDVSWNGSPYSFRLSTEDYLDNGANWASATATKRLWRGNAMSKVLVEWVFAYGSQYGGASADAISPRQIQFGLDVANSSGARRYFTVRYLVGVTSTLTQKFQALNTDSSTYSDIPGGAIPLGVNENKMDLARVEVEFDLANAKYNGLRVNGLGLGSLADTPDTTISALASPAAETLTSFASGMNLVFGIRNRNDTQNSRCWANLCYVKAVYS